MDWSLIGPMARRLLATELWTFHQGLPSLDAVSFVPPAPGDKHSKDFEEAFTYLIGPGESVAFGAGRMGFYSLMKVLGIGEGDEVVLPGYTCAVMPNAVLRAGARPIYTDVSRVTLGSDANAVERVVTPRTRMVVAQHSFGYPCDIVPIQEFSLKHGLFLLEDCATSLGSTINGASIGTFGDAALFSLDHTKPLVSHTGGVIYSENPGVIDALRAAQSSAPDLPLDRQQAMWERMVKEASMRSPRGQLRLFVHDLIAGLRGSPEIADAFLTEDFSDEISQDSYPYPARLPAFVAKVGIAQIAVWPERARRRRANMRVLIDALKGTMADGYLPPVLSNPDADVVPLRLAWTQPNGAEVRRRLRTRVTTEGTWFRDPISVATSPLEAYGYRRGSCPVSEQIGPGMVNLPIPDEPDDASRLAALVHRRLAL